MSKRLSFFWKAFDSASKASKASAGSKIPYNKRPLSPAEASSLFCLMARVMGLSIDEMIETVPRLSSDVRLSAGQTRVEFSAPPPQYKANELYPDLSLCQETWDPRHQAPGNEQAEHRVLHLEGGETIDLSGLSLEEEDIILKSAPPKVLSLRPPPEAPQVKMHFRRGEQDPRKGTPPPKTRGSGKHWNKCKDSAPSTSQQGQPKSQPPQGRPPKQAPTAPPVPCPQPNQVTPRPEAPKHRSKSDQFDEDLGCALQDRSNVAGMTVTTAVNLLVSAGLLDEVRKVHSRHQYTDFAEDVMTRLNNIIIDSIVESGLYDSRRIHVGETIPESQFDRLKEELIREIRPHNSFEQHREIIVEISDEKALLISNPATRVPMHQGMDTVSALNSTRKPVRPAAQGSPRPPAIAYKGPPGRRSEGNSGASA